MRRTLTLRQPVPLTNTANQDILPEVNWLPASQDILPEVNWLILGSKLPGKVIPEHHIDLRLWLSGEID